jgi:hypothetical protein
MIRFSRKVQVDWNADLNALTKKGYRVEYLGYVTKERVAIRQPNVNPNDPPEKVRQEYVRYWQQYNHDVWEAAKRNGWKEDPLTNKQFIDRLAEGTQTKALLGTVVWGHGGPTGLLLNAAANNQKDFDKYFITYDAWQSQQKYKLGVGIMYACFTASARSADRVRKGTNVFSTNGIFWGADARLVPPLCGPIIERVLRRFKEIKIGDTTFRPPNVQAVLDRHKEVQ